MQHPSWPIKRLKCGRFALAEVQSGDQVLLMNGLLIPDGVGVVANMNITKHDRQRVGRRPHLISTISREQWCSCAHIC